VLPRCPPVIPRSYADDLFSHDNPPFVALMVVSIRMIMIVVPMVIVSVRLPSGSMVPWMIAMPVMRSSFMIPAIARSLCD
jgi:hypothetical protein